MFFNYNKFFLFNNKSKFVSAAQCSTQTSKKSSKDFLLDFGYVETVSSVLQL